MEMVVRGAQSLAVRCLQKRGLKYDLEGKYVSGRNMDALRGGGALTDRTFLAGFYRSPAGKTIRQLKNRQNKQTKL